MVHTRGTLVFLIDDYEIEIDHDGQTSGGAIYLRLAGQKNNIPIRINAAAQLGAALTQLGAVAGAIESAVERLARNTAAQQESLYQFGIEQ